MSYGDKNNKGTQKIVPKEGPAELNNRYLKSNLSKKGKRIFKKIKIVKQQTELHKYKEQFLKVISITCVYNLIGEVFNERSINK